MDSLHNTIRWRLDDQSLKPASTLEQLLRSATGGPQIDEDLLEEFVQFHPHLNRITLKSELALLSHNIADNIPRDAGTMGTRGAVFFHLKNIVIETRILVI